jgi:potassium inwardly-rectifying channel subfamily J
VYLHNCYHFRWASSLFLFANSFYFTWLAYGLIYYLICYCHGDFEDGHLPSDQAKSNWMPCILEIDSFAAAFLFSLETQHTIGYGSRQITTECAAAMVVMSTQSIIGCLIQAFMVGLVFAKLCTPNNR